MKPEKTHVLIVDDDQAIRSSLRRVLEGADYEVLVAANAQEAERRFEPGRVDLVLLDLNLPLQSGWDVFEHLTTQQPSVPVIIITGMPHQYRTAVAAGACALLEKPIEASVLLKVMDELLAEPEEARLRRLCGYQQDTKYVRPHTPRAKGKSEDPTMAVGARLGLSSSPRQREE